MDADKCKNCSVPISHCDGMTRYKCGREEKDVGKYCRFKKTGR